MMCLLKVLLHTSATMAFCPNVASQCFALTVVAVGQPCIVMAAPGMLQSGTSRALFELWCQDPYVIEAQGKNNFIYSPRQSVLRVICGLLRICYIVLRRNGIILTGYSVRGTIADELKRNPHSLQFQRDGPSVQVVVALCFFSGVFAEGFFFGRFNVVRR